MSLSSLEPVLFPIRKEDTRGRWFDTGHDRVDLVHRASNTRLSQNWRPTSSLQSPTVLTAVSLVTARQSAVSGLLTLTSSASGAYRATAARDVEHTGILRKDRNIPSGSDRVADRLADPVPSRQLDVVDHAFESTDGERDDHELGAIQRLSQIRRRGVTCRVDPRDGGDVLCRPCTSKGATPDRSREGQPSRL